MGVTFKEDVTDIRNSKVADVVYALKSYHLNVEIVDPLADNEEVQHEYGFSISKNPTSQGYDAIIVAVSHKEYIALNEDYFKGLLSQNGLLMDLKGIYRNKFKNLNIWSL
jgi:UDP-N-acetyl-D-galactosamine dehydrogenase